MKNSVLRFIKKDLVVSNEIGESIVEGGNGSCRNQGDRQMKMKMINVTEATMKELVEFHNVNSEKPVKKFADRVSAERRVTELIEKLNAKPEPKSRSDGIRESWKNPDIAAKRAQRSGVSVDGVEHKSVRAAFDALGINQKHRIQFRMLLKEKGSMKEEGRLWKVIPRNYGN